MIERYILSIPVFISIGICLKSVYILLLSIALIINRNFFPLIFIIIGFIRINIADYSLDIHKTYITGIVEEVHGNSLIVNDNGKRKIFSRIKHNAEVGDTIRTKIVPSNTKKCHSYDYDFENYLKLYKIKSMGYTVQPIYIIKKGNSKIKNIENIIKNKYSRNYPLAIALTLGDRSYLNKKIKDNFSRNGMSHLLAISGLHISMVIYSVYFFLRTIMCLFPSIVLKYNNYYKVLLIVSWIFGLIYTVISGSGIPAIRALLMSLITILLVIFNRRSLTLRSVSYAATIILIIYPYSIFSPSFQMSFAAVTALIYYRESSLIKSTIVASLATMPFSMYHFHYFSSYGSLINLIAIPLTTFIIMPILMINITSTFFNYPLLFIEWPLQLLNSLASINLPYSLHHCSMTSTTLILIVFSMLSTFILNKTHLSIILLIVAIILPTERPRIFISGSTIGVRDNKDILFIEGRARNAPRRWAEFLGYKIKKVKRVPIDKYFDIDKVKEMMKTKNNFIEIYDSGKIIFG